MSLVIGWRRFLEVRLEDDGGNPVDAFETRLTAATRANLAMYRLLAKPRRDGLALFYRVNPEAVPELLGEIDTRQRFSFTLHLRQLDFFNRYYPDLTAATGAGLQLDNLDATGSILPDGAALSVGALVTAADAVEIGRRVFPVHLDLAASSPTGVEARDPFSAALIASAQVFAPAGATWATVTLDLTETGDVLFDLAEVPPGPLNRRAYADDAVAATNAAGILNLYWETSQMTAPSPDGLVYHAVFGRR